MSIEISQETQARLNDEARKEGVSIDALLQRLMDEHETASKHHDRVSAETATEPPPLQTAADIILESMRAVPPEIMAMMPADGASQHDHYIYGWPKREV